MVDISALPSAIRGRATLVYLYGRSHVFLVLLIGFQTVTILTITDLFLLKGLFWGLTSVAVAVIMVMFEERLDWCVDSRAFQVGNNRGFSVLTKPQQAQIDERMEAIEEGVRNVMSDSEVDLVCSEIRHVRSVVVPSYSNEEEIFGR